MNWQSLKTVIPAVLLAVAVAPHNALSQSLFGGGVNYNYSNNYAFEMTMARIIMMALSVGSGFCLGWFLSPQARELRRIIALCLTGVVIVLAVLNNGVLGWSAAWIVSFVGFFAALGYWLGRGVKAMLETPTTFGSSMWATIEHMIEKMRLREDQQLILIENTNPIMAKKIKWYEDPEMSAKGVNTHQG